jgi:hypothetical protein
VGWWETLDFFNEMDKINTKEVREMLKERFREALKKIVEVPPANSKESTLEWKIEVLSHIRDLRYMDMIEEAIEAVEEWAEWREKNVEIDLPERLWEIKKQTWLRTADMRGWDYVAAAVIREFAKEMANITLDLNLEKVAKIYSLVALAFNKDKKRTLNLLIDFMDYFRGDIEALISRLENILDTGTMDRKRLLLKLCEELTTAVEYFYHEEDAGLKAHLGEVLGRYGSLLSNIGWAITWTDEEVQDKVFKAIEKALKRKHLLKCRLEEWLSWKVREIVDEVFEDKGEETETQQPQPPTDELPF